MPKFGVEAIEADSVASTRSVATVGQMFETCLYCFCQSWGVGVIKPGNGFGKNLRIDKFALCGGASDLVGGVLFRIPVVSAYPFVSDMMIIGCFVQPLPEGEIGSALEVA